MKLGIISVAFGQVGYKEAAEKTGKMGFASTHFQFKHITDVMVREPGKMSTGLANEVAETYARHGVTIPALGCYMNLIHPDDAQRASNVRFIKEHLRFARDFGASVVTTESGTASLTSQWEHHPDNQSEANWKLLQGVLTELAEEAEKWGVFLGLEGYINNAINTAERMQRMLGEVGSSHVGVVMDPCNYVYPEHKGRADEVLRDAFERLGEHILIAHAKDYAFSPEGGFAQPEPPAGTGMLNYPLYLSLLEQAKPHCGLFLEHLTERQMPHSIALIREAAATIGGDAS